MMFRNLTHTGFNWEFIGGCLLVLALGFLFWGGLCWALAYAVGRFFDALS
jgi:hypothetical protein